MNEYKEKIIGFVKNHKRGIKIGIMALIVGSMVFKGLMQIPQINGYKTQAAKLGEQIEYEKNRQQEVSELRGKVNTDEYIEKVASEKLGLIKSNSKIFIDVSGEQ